MKEIERYFKIYFDEGGNDDFKYYIEEKNVDSDREYITLLVQGYVRCLNNLKKETFGHDEKASLFLLNILRRFLMISYQNIETINNNFYNSNFDIIEFLINKDKGTNIKDAFLNAIFNSSFSETKNINEISTNINVKYELKVGIKGMVIMYEVSPRINSFIQMQSYITLFSHLLPRLNTPKSFLFFINYMIEIDKEINKNDYTSILGMRNIIKNASNNFRNIVKEWSEMDDKDGFAKLELCLPRF